MPARPSWYARTDEIRRLIQRIHRPVIDRATIEKTFRLSRRQAIRLMANLSGHKVGCAYVVDRADLLEKLSQLARSRPVRQEQRRKQHVVEVLAELEQEATARTTRVKLPVRSARGLPEGISLTRSGQISIEFQSPEDLLGRVLALTEAAASDYQDFARTVAGRKP
jgi:hypothetical protein